MGPAPGPGRVQRTTRNRQDDGLDGARSQDGRGPSPHRRDRASHAELPGRTASDPPVTRSRTLWRRPTCCLATRSWLIASTPAPPAGSAGAEVAVQASVELVNIHLVCSDAAEHRRRVEARVADIPGHVLPTWDAVTRLEFEARGDDHLRLDTCTMAPAELDRPLRRLHRRTARRPAGIALRARATLQLGANRSAGSLEPQGCGTSSVEPGHVQHVAHVRRRGRPASTAGCGRRCRRSRRSPWRPCWRSAG